MTNCGPEKEKEGMMTSAVLGSGFPASVPDGGEKAMGCAETRPLRLRAGNNSWFVVLMFRKQGQGLRAGLGWLLSTVCHW